MPDSAGKAIDSASMPSPWMNVAEAASFARVSHSTLRRAIRRHRLIAFRVGSAIRLQRDDVDSWMRAVPTQERVIG